MACYRPLKITNPKGFVDLPITVRCGQCIGCRLDRSRQWAVRCVHEAQLYDRNCFITLTYATECLPPYGTLVKRDFQLFIKRARRKLGAFRFFHCGEYGDLNRRPHYHAILFGVDFADKVAWSRGESGEVSYTSQTLSDLWGLGFSTVGSFSFESAAYVARYVVKKITGDMAASHYRVIDPDTGECVQLLPEYTTMSLKPGIGARWYSSYRSDVYPSGIVTIRGRGKMNSPRYYDKLYRKDNREAWEELRAERLRAEHKDRSPDRLAVREKVAVAQASLFKRKG